MSGVVCHTSQKSGWARTVAGNVSNVRLKVHFVLQFEILLIFPERLRSRQDKINKLMENMELIAGGSENVITTEKVGFEGLTGTLAKDIGRRICRKNPCNRD